MKIALISCSSNKNNFQNRAKYLYASPLFKYSLAFAESLKPDKIYILSAKYGLLNLEDKVTSYNETLNKMSSAKIKNWASKIIKELSKKSDIKNDEFIFLAGKKYRDYLTQAIKNYKIPMEGLSIGNQLSFLKKQLNDKIICGKIHKLALSAKKFKFPFRVEKIPPNGIYILFEKGERGHGKNRIVRIGTHTGEKQLGSRLQQHFINENKDRSIFRKNIGRAMLNKKNDPFMKHWELDLTPRKARKKYQNKIDRNYQRKIEKEITKYIRDKFYFVIIRVDNYKKRLDVESKLISTISQCNICRPSDSWLGNYSPKDKIKESGLWLVNELFKVPLLKNDLNFIRNSILK